MKTPKQIQPLINDGLVDEVIQQLMSGKEATVFKVRCGTEIRCAKVYKQADKRSFKQAVLYQEGRKGRNSRRARAIAKGSKFGRDQQENAWQNTEVDALYKLADAGVRVPKPYGCFDGVLLMELITDEDGNVAPRLNDVSMSTEQALEDHKVIIQYIVMMLCSGIIHGDLSQYNVLVDQYGPVIIDLPQAVDAAGNNSAQSMLMRDVNNMTAYYAQYAPELSGTQYGKEIWALYEKGKLLPETKLTGNYDETTESVDVEPILLEIQAAFLAEQERQERMRSIEEPEQD
ncbi:MAG: serine protein kinase RIO [Gammaproteobacteria bacterium]|nr:MAG: serine protein kinase RIO [Gammaproteobacteria bacterium]